MNDTEDFEVEEPGQFEPRRFDWFDLIAVGTELAASVAGDVADALLTVKTFALMHHNWRFQQRERTTFEDEVQRTIEELPSGTASGNQELLG